MRIAEPDYLDERAVRRVPQRGDGADEDEHQKAGQALEGIGGEGADQRVGNRRWKERSVEGRQIRAEGDHRPLSHGQRHGEDDKLHFQAACRQADRGPAPSQALGEADGAAPERPFAPFIAFRASAGVGPGEQDVTERAATMNRLHAGPIQEADPSWRRMARRRMDAMAAAPTPTGTALNKASVCAEPIRCSVSADWASLASFPCRTRIVRSSQSRAC